MTSDLASQSYTAQHSIRPSVRGNSDSGTTVHALNAYLGALDSSGVRKIARHDKLTYHYPATTFISGKWKTMLIVIQTNARVTACQFSSEVLMDEILFVWI